MWFRFSLIVRFLYACAVVEASQWPMGWVKGNIRSTRPYPKQPGKRVPVPALYYKRYSEQTFIGTHDCAAIRTEENNWSLSGNQYFNISVQLESGVRLLQAQGHADPNGSSEIRLCHFNCALMDGGSLDEFLRTVKGFLEDNPNEIVTLLFVNTGIRLVDWARAYHDTGFDILSYVPPIDRWGGKMQIKNWPTIADLVAANKRAITFLSSGADQARIPYLLPEFDYVFETKFGIEAPDQYTCAPSRPQFPGGIIPNRLSLVDHFLYAKFFGIRYPNASYANTTNSATENVGELGEHAARCRERYGRRPNFFLVDFFNEGDVFEVEYRMNSQ